MLVEIDKLIRAGQIAEAESQLSELKVADLSRDQLSHVANLYRRSGKPEDALRVLRHYVRPKSKSPQKAHIEEVFEYAVSLIKLGAINEGCKLLEPISGKEHPDKYLHLAFAHISLWDYHQASQLLEEYRRHPKITSYSRLIAEVNLLSCYVFLGQDAASEELLATLISQTQSPDYKRLWSGVFRSKTQLHLIKGEISQAKMALAESYSSVESRSALDDLLFEKWSAIIQLHESGPCEQMKEILNALKIKALELQHFETLRDLDFYEALHFKEQRQIFHVFFGTPYESYREKIRASYRKLHGRELDIPPVYTRFLLPPNFSGKPHGAGSLHIANGINTFSKASLVPGQLLQSFLKLLSRDFYKPVGIYQVHQELFQEHFFNETSTVTKIRQLVHRLNTWFKENSIPLEVHSRKAFFHLTAKVPLNLIFTENPAFDPRLEKLSLDLKKAFGKKYFTVKEVAKYLKMPHRTATTYIRKAHQAKLIERDGAGPKTKYQLIES